MLSLKSIIVATVLTVMCSEFISAKFPDDPKPCKYEDSECIKKVINYYMNELSEGDSSINLVTTDPFKISKIKIKQGADSPVNIDLVFSNSDLIGLKTLTTYKVSGFGKDLTQKHELRIKIKNISIIGDYSITGKVLILPIRGSGSSNMTMVNVDMGMTFMGEPFEKDGATYMKPKNFKITIDPEKLYLNFENLFNGDKELSDTMNLFLNENWKDIYEELRGSIQNVMGKICESVIANVFTKYPYEKYFSS